MTITLRVTVTPAAISAAADTQPAAPRSSHATRNVVAIHPLERPDQYGIVRAREPELAVLGDAPLSEGDGILRVAPRRKGEVGKRREKWRCEAALKPLDERLRNFKTGMLGH